MPTDAGAPVTAAQRAYTVGELADLAKVSVRTLHHYDSIALLAPSRRTEAGYRLYGHDEPRATPADPGVPGARLLT